MAIEQPAAPSEFRIPLDLLKHFTTDVRVLPQYNPTNGYIIFDKAMLLSVLRSDKLEVRQSFAKAIEAYKGELVLMEPGIQAKR
jgi:hypothetical protein